MSTAAPLSRFNRSGVWPGCGGDDLENSVTAARAFWRYF